MRVDSLAFTDPDTEDIKYYLKLPNDPHMPSATGNPTPGASTKESTSKRQNTVVGEDELNVLDDYR